jgi:hypothetical protein
VAFRIASDSDIEIFAVILTDILDKVNCMGEKRVPDIGWSFLTGLVASQCQYILTPGIVSVLKDLLVIQIFMVQYLECLVNFLP